MSNKKDPEDKRVCLAFTLNPKTVERLRQLSKNHDLPMCRIVEGLVWCRLKGQLSDDPAHAGPRVTSEEGNLVVHSPEPVYSAAGKKRLREAEQRAAVREHGRKMAAEAAERSTK